MEEKDNNIMTKTTVLDEKIKRLSFEIENEETELEKIKSEIKNVNEKLEILDSRTTEIEQGIETELKK